MTAIQRELGHFIPGLDQRTVCASLTYPGSPNAQWENIGTFKNHSPHSAMDAYICCHETLLGRAGCNSFSMKGDNNVGYIYPGGVRREGRAISSIKIVEGEQEPGWD